jgi:hypothetical protein
MIPLYAILSDLLAGPLDNQYGLSNNTPVNLLKFYSEINTNTSIINISHNRSVTLEFDLTRGS